MLQLLDLSWAEFADGNQAINVFQLLKRIILKDSENLIAQFLSFFFNAQTNGVVVKVIELFLLSVPFDEPDSVGLSLAWLPFS